MRPSLIAVCTAIATAGVAAAQPSVRVEPSAVQGLRALEEQTAKAAIRDYLESWQSLSEALAQNRAALLDTDFVGDAREKLGATVREQRGLGIHTRYRDRAHDLQIVCYSPEGLSIELKDTAEYDVQLFDHGKPAATRRVRAHYIAVLTPSEVRWRVRVFQAVPAD